MKKDKELISRRDGENIGSWIERYEKELHNHHHSRVVHDVTEEEPGESLEARLRREQAYHQEEKERCEAALERLERGGHPWFWILVIVFFLGCFFGFSINSQTPAPRGSMTTPQNIEQ